MKQVQKITLAILAVLPLAMLLGASTASATTLEVKGVGQNSTVKLQASLASGNSALLTSTGGGSVHTCLASVIEWHTSGSFSGTAVGGPADLLEWGSCTEGFPTADAAGTLSVERIGTTTNGTVRSNGAKITVPSAFGTLTCTSSNTDLGTLTGVSSGRATMDINTVFSCTVIGTANWIGTYTVTSPEGLGVTG